MNSVDSNGLTPLDYYFEQGNFHLVETLFTKLLFRERYKYPIEIFFHFACKFGHLKIVDRLFNIYPSFEININKKDIHGMAGIHWAIKNGHFLIVE